MENASKALAMAGGLLLAIIIIAVLMYVVQNTASLKKAEEDKEIAEQITKFNMEYESYEKTLLRGTELVTLINKAIENNKKYEDSDKVYDIDIHFKLKTPIKETIVTVEEGKKKNTEEKVTFGEAKTYKLIDNNRSDRINADISQFMNIGALNSTDAYEIINYKDIDNYQMVYSGFTDFKRKIFKCTKIEYIDVTGRVDLLEFEEVDLKEDTSGY